MPINPLILDELRIGDVQDAVIQVQDRWFMETALSHNVWFPPSSRLRGLKPTKYVAYYQTAGNEMPGHVTHVARVRIVWNGISFQEAVVLPELQSLFADELIRERVSTFRNDEGLFHIAITDKPLALRYPLPLGNPRNAQVLTTKRFPLSHLLAAKTTDDLLGLADA